MPGGGGNVGSGRLNVLNVGLCAVPRTWNAWEPSGKLFGLFLARDTMV